MTDDTYVEQAKKVLLYEQVQGSDFHEMLDESEVNTRTNQKMRDFAILVGQTERAWRGNYRHLFSGLVRQMHRGYLNDEGYARNQAIAIVKGRAGVLPSGDGDKKKGGILGMLGK